MPPVKAVGELPSAPAQAGHGPMLEFISIWLSEAVIYRAERNQSELPAVLLFTAGLCLSDHNHFPTDTFSGI